MIADRIKLARCRAGFSLRGLSDAMQNRVTARAVGKYERGEDVPSSGVLISLAKALGVSLAFFLTPKGFN
jgi:transcriptional regulator with XRE-family HTH domain